MKISKNGDNDDKYKKYTKFYNNKIGFVII